MGAPNDDLFSPRGPREETPAAPEATARVQTVRELTRRIAGALGDMGRVSVEGEISRIMRASSGHVYFDLKDIDAKLACTIWKSQLVQAARFELKEGLQVIAHGKLDVYAPRGSYSLIVQRLEPAGIGALLAELEGRKQELKARGWFDRKRPVPSWPRRLGVATSRDGAAFQDFLRTRSLRFAGYPLLFAHTPVQGPGASAEIARAIGRLEARGADVIVICRGGGSLEDLWAFNELPLLEAIWNCKVPIVSGVGHEVDVTLSDLVADLRAHTPTDAAQIVIPDRRACVDELERAAAHLARGIDLALAARAERLARASGSRVLRDPRTLIGMRRERLGRFAVGLESNLARRLERARARLAVAARALERAGPRARMAQNEKRLEALRHLLRARMGSLMEKRVARHGRAAAQLGSLSPSAILKRGYSISEREDGRIVRSVGDLAPGETLVTRVVDGRVTSRVQGTESNPAEPLP